MNVAETIQRKVFHLPLKAQEEILEIVEQFEDRYHPGNETAPNNGGGIRELFGSVSLGYATGADNESIDADLGREYMNSHEVKP